jgi:hypothetical protein
MPAAATGSMRPGNPINRSDAYTSNARLRPLLKFGTDIGPPMEECPMKVSATRAGRRAQSGFPPTAAMACLIDRCGGDFSKTDIDDLSES